MISVAAELAGMHPQTLRMYGGAGLITPKRSPRNTRLYSQADVELLRRIQRDDQRRGAQPGGRRVGARARAAPGADARRLARMRKRAAAMEATMTKELVRLRKWIGGELPSPTAPTSRRGCVRAGPGFQSGAEPPDGLASTAGTTRPPLGAGQPPRWSRRAVGAQRPRAPRTRRRQGASPVRTASATRSPRGVPPTGPPDA